MRSVPITAILQANLVSSTIQQLLRLRTAQRKLYSSNNETKSHSFELFHTRCKLRSNRLRLQGWRIMTGEAKFVVFARWEEAHMTSVWTWIINLIQERSTKALKTTWEVVTFAYKRMEETAKAEGSTSFLVYSLSKEWNIGDGWFWDVDDECELMSSRSGWSKSALSQEIIWLVLRWPERKMIPDMKLLWHPLLNLIFNLQQPFVDLDYLGVHCTFRSFRLQGSK